MDSSSKNKLQKLGFQFWKPIGNTSKLSKDEEVFFLCNGNVLCIIPKQDISNSLNYETFFSSLSKALNSDKGYFKRVQNFSLFEEIRLILIFGSEGYREITNLKKSSATILFIESLEDIFKAKELKKKLWLSIKEFSSDS
tara:strand:- start:1618 stop:2037 length:420 start_codon:yes stop_codon:yes gene_type:complete